MSVPVSEDTQGTVDIDQVGVLSAKYAMPYQDYVLQNPEACDEQLVRKYVGFVGLDCAERMLLYRPSDEENIWL